MKYIILFLIIMTNSSCTSRSGNDAPDTSIRTGAEQMEKYLPLLAGKNIALVANQTSVVGETHLVDTVLALSKEYALTVKQVMTPPGKHPITLKHVFAPEHGFRGTVDDGKWVDDETDPVTGVPIISIYGKNKKPLPEMLEGIELVVFDIQDVGTRFYTFISTMHYVMEACAEQGIPLMVLDRPNPNGNYVDGPILDPEFRSFVGMHPIPVVHGLTVGELAGMINGEGWLEDGVQCELTVIPCANYTHDSSYLLPVKPSPNLPRQHAIRLYPSTCFFEGTVISEGRGTETPFEVFGHPDLPYDFSFVPRPIEGMETRPKLMGEQCNGMDLRSFEPEEGWTRIYLHWLINAYNDFPDKASFFTPFFDKLAGTDELRMQIEKGYSEQEIRASWKNSLEDYMAMRETYLLYE
jgi:uncharacterized protein YbbC (DUF1343 family)